MKPQFTAQGVEVRTFDEIFTELADEYRAIYGANITVDQESPDGQRIGIMVKAIMDMEAYALTLYTEFDPDFARGELLNKIIKFAGIVRNSASDSHVNCTVTTDKNLTLEVGYTVKDNNGNEWELRADAILTVGANTVTFFAVESGAVVALAGTIVTPVTIVLGVVSVVNPFDAVIGRDEETDPELRLRRNRSVENPSYSTLGGLFAKIADLTGVTGVRPYENNTAVPDLVKNIPPHAIWMVVQGGTVSEIIETIAKNRTGGAGTKGAVIGDYIEKVIRPDGTILEITHSMSFDRPTEIPLHVRLTATRKSSSNPVDKDLIKNKLSAIDFSIAQDAIVTELYSAVYSAGTNFVATNLEVSTDGVTYVSSQILAGFADIFTIAIADIDITEVV